VDRLCQNAFLWKEGPFTLMNKMGINEALHIVTERMELSHRREISFPVPALLIAQAQKNEPWPLEFSPVVYSQEQNGQVARIMISNSKMVNALDNQVFEDLKDSCKKANQDEKIKAIIFDSGPIKTFIAGTNVSHFIRQMREENFQGIKEDTIRWQDVLFHQMTGSGKPKIAIVDGAAFGGGAEVALALAIDPDSLVIVTDRTSFAFPETRLGIYPGLRGTLTFPQLIDKATGDTDLTLALSRYYILGGGILTSSSRLIKYLGMADFLVAARKRDDAAEILAQAIIENGGKPLSDQQKKSLKIEELPSELIPGEKMELVWIKNLFLKDDFMQTLFAYGRGEEEIPFAGERKIFVERISRRIAKNSPHALNVTHHLINQGFEDYLKGKSLHERAQWELENWLLPTFQHPDAIEGMTALVERRAPKFSQKQPDKET
jgi:enoyl-CoA hydratase/carnithine racemase